MLIYALVVLVLLLLILLFRYLPHRIFIVFVALAAVLCAIVVHMQLPERAPCSADAGAARRNRTGSGLLYAVVDGVSEAGR